MADAKKKPGAAAPKKPGWDEAQPGMEPGDEWGEDNPGNVHGVGQDDHVFFHRDGVGPHAGRVLAHGVHGCTVEDDGGARHKVRWGRVHGLKKKAVLSSMRVVDQGEAGAIVEHEDGRRLFVAGDLPIEEAQTKFSDVAGLEDGGRKPKRPKISDLEPFARAAGADLAKADHDCEGPALCLVCQARALEAAADLAKSFGDSGASLEALKAAVTRLRAGALRPMLKSVGAGSRPLPMLLRKD